MIIPYRPGEEQDEPHPDSLSPGEQSNIPLPTHSPKVKKSGPKIKPKISSTAGTIVSAATKSTGWGLAASIGLDLLLGDDEGSAEPPQIDYGTIIGPTGKKKKLNAHLNIPRYVWGRGFAPIYQIQAEDQALAVNLLGQSDLHREPLQKESPKWAYYARNLIPYSGKKGFSKYMGTYHTNEDFEAANPDLAGQAGTGYTAREAQESESNQPDNGAQHLTNSHGG